MLKTSSCLSETISFHFACRPLRATSVRRAQPSDGASSQGNVGPGAPQGTMKNETGSMNKGTTGASSRPSPGGDASTSGTSTAAGTHNTGSATTPGAVKEGVNKP